MKKTNNYTAVLLLVLSASPLLAVAFNLQVVDTLLMLDVLSGHAILHSLIGIGLALGSYLLYQTIYASEAQRPFIRISLFSLLVSTLSFLFLTAGPVALMQKYSLIPLASSTAIIMSSCVLIYSAVQIALDLTNYQCRNIDDLRKYLEHSTTTVAPWLLVFTTIVALFFFAIVLLVPDTAPHALIILTYTIWLAFITLVVRPQLIRILSR